MKVGLHFDLDDPLPSRRSAAHLYGFTLEACQEAERLGIGSAWFSEHHLGDRDKLPTPLTFAAAVAARTRHIRLGAIITPALHHPAEIAEQAVVVDVLSDGRLDLGMRVGDRGTEFHLYDAPMDAPDADTDVATRRLRTLWASAGIRPTSVQDRLPMWLEYVGRQGAYRAGLLGEHLLSADAALWPHYREGLRDGGQSPDGAMMAGRVQAWSTEDPERDWPRVSAYLAQHPDVLLQPGTRATVQIDSSASEVGDPLGASAAGPFESFIFGTPEFVAQTIRTGADGAPVDTVILPATIGGMDDTTVMRNIDLICERLIPLLGASVAVGT